ncbi:membrane protein YfhO [Alteromonadaceae bacterium Bs31]|nr:membrane protein YfhO [Alteromonadaceae bacterium Bs31]
MLFRFPLGNRLAWLLLLLVLAAVTRDIIGFPRDPNTLEYSTFAGHEWIYNQYRIAGMAQALAEGMPGRWLESFSHGWGYPLFHYTGPLPYTVGAGLHLFGLESHAALNFSWWLAFALSGITMFWTMRRMFGDWGALLASTIYLFAPYHLVDMFVRTNLVETTAFVFPPLILYGLWKMAENPVRGIVVGAIGVALLPLTHMLSAYLIGLGLAVFCLCYLLLLPLREKLAFALHACVMAVLGLGLSAFFWLPALADLNAVKGMDAITAGNYDYKYHFVYLSQLISDYWGYGASGKGLKNDYMSFSLGKVSVSIGLIVLMLALYLIVKKCRLLGIRVLADSAEPMRKVRFLLACFAAALFCAYMASYLSSPLWKIIPMVEATQFPWRFLFPASFFLAVLAGGLPSLLSAAAGERNYLQFPVALVASVLVVYFHWSFAQAGSYDRVANVDLTRNEMQKVGVWTTNQHEFLPKGARVPWASEPAKREVKFYTETMAIESRVLSSEWKSGEVLLNLLPGSAGTVVVAQHWHPGWQASVDGVSIAPQPFIGHPYAPIALEVPANTHQVLLRYGYTPVGKYGLFISLFVLLAGGTFLLVKGKSFELKRVWLAASVLFATLVFYWFSSNPSTVSLNERIKGVENEVKASSLAEIKQNRTSWNAPGNAVFPESGLLVHFDKRIHDKQLQLSTDSNDYHLLVFLDGDKTVGTEVLRPRYVPGVSNHGLDLPAHISEHGYNRLAILPTSGDGFYSLAHIFTSNGAKLKNAQVVMHQQNFRLVETSYEALPKHVRTGSDWQEPGNVRFSEGGIDVQFKAPVQSSRIQLSLDHNDYHQVLFYLGEELVGRKGIVPRSPLRGGGMRNYRMAVPEQAVAAGFDKLKVVPTMGDGYYSLGHLKLY